MKVNLNRMFVDIYGKEKSDESIMKDAVAQGLYVGQGVENTPDAKYAAYKLCNKIMNSEGEIEIDEKERSMIRNVSCVVLTPGGFGQIMEILEGE